MNFETLRQKMLEKGYIIQTVPVERLSDLEKDVKDLRNSGYFTDVVNKIVTDFYSFKLPDVPFKINSVIIVAMPSPIVKINFNWKAKKIPILLPPTYMDYNEKPAEIENCLNEIISPHGLHAAKNQRLPEKLIGVRSGLSLYGRNNIAYVNGIGSFAYLSTYYSDMPSTENNWLEICQMDSCKNCTLCLNECPTSAIDGERYLIKVERCITYHNEFTGTSDFPKWIDPTAHNCIVGCLKCQTCCPKNKNSLNNVMEFGEISQEETEILLEGRKFEDLPPALACKIKQLNLIDYIELLPRNLKAVLEKECQPIPS